jgi:NAD-dependent deacetylase
MKDMERKFRKAGEKITGAKRVAAFCGAGISVESGIPPFRGENGLWNKYNPRFLEIGYFLENPEESWKVIKEIFYDFFGRAKPNAAHKALAVMEEKGLIHAVITQNIDNLHQEAGSKEVYEFHGNSQHLICLDCKEVYPVSEIELSKLPPKCLGCGGLLKPDFIFFGEPIPEPARTNSFLETKRSDVFILVGTTGEVMPASLIPMEAKHNGAFIIEVNIERSNYTDNITDIFLQGKATEVMKKLLHILNLE